MAWRAPRARWCRCARRSPSGWAIERSRSPTGCQNASCSSTSDGHPVTLPEPGTSKAWTAVEHRGNRVAAIIHDARAAGPPELVEAAAAGAVLALDNERLKADLNARLQELRASRRRIVEATVRGAAAGSSAICTMAPSSASSRCRSTCSCCGQIAGRARRSSCSTATIATLGEAQTELRELARGIHPPMLADRGLAPALDALAQRSTVPVELDLRLNGRLPKQVETAGYFVVAEALTNVVKYARATHARLSGLRRRWRAVARGRATTASAAPTRRTAAA